MLLTATAFRLFSVFCPEVVLTGSRVVEVPVYQIKNRTEEKQDRDTITLLWSCTKPHIIIYLLLFSFHCEGMLRSVHQEQPSRNASGLIRDLR